jgi:hypothetical protein
MGHENSSLEISFGQDVGKSSGMIEMEAGWNAMLVVSFWNMNLGRDSIMVLKQTGG